MAETVTLNEGQKVRVGKASYEVVEDASFTGQFLLPNAKAQKNRHLKVVCTNPACVALREAEGKKAYSLRGSRDMFLDGLPFCGVCGGKDADGSQRTMQPDGWSLTTETSDND